MRCTTHMDISIGYSFISSLRSQKRLPGRSVFLNYDPEYGCITITQVEKNNRDKDPKMRETDVNGRLQVVQMAAVLIKEGKKEQVRLGK